MMTPRWSIRRLGSRMGHYAHDSIEATDQHEEADTAHWVSRSRFGTFANDALPQRPNAKRARKATRKRQARKRAKMTDRSH